VLLSACEIPAREGIVSRRELDINRTLRAR
jgi:hypothetical protein